METHTGGTADHHSSAGFAVRDDALANCAKDAGRIAAELRTLAREDLRTVRGLPEDAFGPLARTTGFHLGTHAPERPDRLRHRGTRRRPERDRIQCRQYKA